MFMVISCVEVFGVPYLDVCRLGSWTDGEFVIVVRQCQLSVASRDGSGHCACAGLKRYIRCAEL